MGGKCDNKEPNFNIAIIQTPMYEWYVVRCRSKNGNYKEIGLRLKINMLPTLGSIVNIICVGEGGLYAHLLSMRIFTLTMN